MAEELSPIRKLIRFIYGYVGFCAAGWPAIVVYMVCGEDSAQTSEPIASRIAENPEILFYGLLLLFNPLCALAGGFTTVLLLSFAIGEDPAVKLMISLGRLLLSPLTWPITSRRDREAFAAKRREAELQQETENKRDSVLFELRLLYDRNSAEIGESFDRERFDQYLDDFFQEDIDYETLAERAQQMEEMILSFFVEDEATERSSLSNIDEEYERRKAEITSSNQDQDTKDSLMARLEKWRAKAMRQQTVL